MNQTFSHSRTMSKTRLRTTELLFVCYTFVIYIAKNVGSRACVKIKSRKIKKKLLYIKKKKLDV